MEKGKKFINSRKIFFAASRAWRRRNLWGGLQGTRSHHTDGNTHAQVLVCTLAFERPTRLDVPCSTAPCACQIIAAAVIATNFFVDLWPPRRASMSFAKF